jgi:Autographiviridae endonuclease VII
MSKTCTKCKTEKPVEAFSVLRAATDGRNYFCRACDSARNKAKWQKNLVANREKKRILALARYAADPERYKGHAKRWRRLNPEKQSAVRRRSMLKSSYGLTEATYAEIEKKQNGVCAICFGRGTHKHLFVDHCHDSKVVRGLLCTACNVGLGYFRNSENLLRGAVAYLQDFKAMTAAKNKQQTNKQEST